MTEAESYLEANNYVTYNFRSNNPSHIAIVRDAINKCIKEEQELRELSRLQIKYSSR